MKVYLTPLNPPNEMQQLAAEGLAAQGSTDITFLLAEVTDHPNRRREYSVISSRDPLPHVAASSLLPIVNETADYRWHLSISGIKNIPPWDDFTAIIHAARPGVMFCVPVPPESMWMNLHPFVLHVWETKDEPLIENWRQTGEEFRQLDPRTIRYHHDQANQRR